VRRIRPNCAVADTSSLGEYLSILCRDEAPFAEGSSTSDRVAGSAVIEPKQANAFV